MARPYTIAATVASISMLSAAPAVAADVKVFAGPAAKCPMSVVTPIYEQETGNHVTFEVSGPVDVVRKVRGGQPFDLVVGIVGILVDFHKQGLVSDPNPVGTMYALVAYPVGAEKPDASSAEALKSVVQRAKSISHSDPSQGGGSAVLFDSVMQSLGMQAEANAKTILTNVGEGAVPVSEGRAEIGIAQSSEVVGLKDISTVRLLPGDPRGKSVFAVAISSKSKAADAAQAFVAAFTSPEVRDQLNKCGFSQD